MSLKRWDARRDANEGQICDALESVGATVCRLDHPLDLLVGYRGVNVLLEVKLPAGPRGGTSHSTLNEKQSVFFAWWRGQRAVVRTPDEALVAIGAAAPHGVDCTES